MKKRVLLIDDDIQLIQELKDNIEFEFQDVLVDTATNYSESWSLLGRTTYDLLIMDIMMTISNEDQKLNPNLSSSHSTGLVLLEAIQTKMEVKSPIVVFTARANIDTNVEESQLVKKVITKPISPVDLKEIIKPFLE